MFAKLHCVAPRWPAVAGALALSVLTACGGGAGSGASPDGTAGTGPTATGAAAADTGAAAGDPSTVAAQRATQTTPSPYVDPEAGRQASTEPDAPTSVLDASRLLHQASFGPTQGEIDRVTAIGARKYVLQQFALAPSVYAYTQPEFQRFDALHTSGAKNFCSDVAPTLSPPLSGSDCWRQYSSTSPVEKDFYAQGAGGDDQLRQRVAFALSQILVVSGHEIEGGYGIAEYQQMLRNQAFGNYRDILRSVVTSPVMGSYLNMVDNDASAPNENFARELLQLFSIGACVLDASGLPAGGACTPSYTNATVREYAFALTGWTYPAGGVDPWCNAACRARQWTNPTYLRGSMVPVTAHHDAQPRALLSQVSLPAGHTPQQAVEAVLDSLMTHPNVAPFVARQLIQFLVTSNPSAAYTARVADAFRHGEFADPAGAIGSRTPGDMRATLAAVLLDPDARDPQTAAGASYGRLRDPAQSVIGALRAFDGRTDGFALSEGWGASSQMGQWVFNSPSVFNFYPTDLPLGGTSLVGPQFGNEGVQALLARANSTYAMLFWTDALNQRLDDAGTVHSDIVLDALRQLIAAPVDAAAVVDRLDRVVTGGRLDAGRRQAVVAAMKRFGPSDTWLAKQKQPSTWQREMVRVAGWLMLSSADYQIQR